MHRCLGSHYAKMMFQVMVGQVLKRLPTSSSPATPTVRRRRRGLRGAQMPVRFTRVRARASTAMAKPESVDG
ncbi:hypothetical protein I553_3922 [Mycobacterium xenopi 4042]|uniref:Cytochrome P450 n=1 Tax=Mycobacterium xenopi 4042 TaxID=1299334 RepID=X8DCJ9_MYCXE|nr:hypothetical protein I553_3922 [Mycobacterium xenopi 4042]